MGKSDFDYLVSAIGPKIKRNDTQLRRAITVEERLMITLRYLATRDEYSKLQFLFRVSKQSISQIVPEVCRCLNEALQDYIKVHF
uniref:Transposase Helix-turn-helix domain-containing protein n=1 Tax=Anopheles minimus TaxID=112268 RepID=A0A182WHM4_9DIPT